MLSPLPPSPRQGGDAARYSPRAIASRAKELAKQNREGARGGVQRTTLTDRRIEQLRHTHEKGRPQTQRVTDDGDALCVCATFHDCEKTATLHPKGSCDFCWGVKSEVFPSGAIYRYYPSDPGWEEVRNMTIQLRRLNLDLPDEFGVGKDQF